MDTYNAYEIDDLYHKPDIDTVGQLVLVSHKHFVHLGLTENGTTLVTVHSTNNINRTLLLDEIPFDKIIRHLCCISDNYIVINTLGKFMIITLNNSLDPTDLTYKTVDCELFINFASIVDDTLHFGKDMNYYCINLLDKEYIVSKSNFVIHTLTSKINVDFPRVGPTGPCITLDYQNSSFLDQHSLHDIRGIVGTSKGLLFNDITPVIIDYNFILENNYDNELHIRKFDNTTAEFNLLDAKGDKVSKDAYDSMQCYSDKNGMTIWISDVETPYLYRRFYLNTRVTDSINK